MLPRSSSPRCDRYGTNSLAKFAQQRIDHDSYCRCRFMNNPQSKEDQLLSVIDVQQLYHKNSYRSTDPRLMHVNACVQSEAAEERNEKINRSEMEGTLASPVENERRREIKFSHLCVSLFSSFRSILRPKIIVKVTDSNISHGTKFLFFVVSFFFTLFVRPVHLPLFG